MAGRARDALEAEERVFVNYKLHEDAEHDLRDAATFYQAQAGEQLSKAFLTEFESTVNHLLNHPRLGPNWRRGKRRMLMHRFPYSIIYDLANDEIRIYAIAHHSRHPTYWRQRSWKISR